MFEAYRDKIHQIPPKKRKEIYIILTIVSILCQNFISINFMWFTFFFGYKIFAWEQTIRLIDTGEKTEFTHNGKTYNIEKATLLLKIEYPRCMIAIMALLLYSSKLGEKVRSIDLYRSEKGAYFLCNLMLDFHMEIEDLSENDAEKWLYLKNREWRVKWQR